MKVAKNKKVTSKESTKEKGSSKVMILIALLLILLIGSVCFTGYIFLTKDKGEAVETVIDESVYELGTFAVNLAEKSPMRYAKITISLGYDTESKLVEELTKKHNKLRDFVNSVLMSKTADQLNSEGIPLVKKEILDGINEMLGEEKAINIYFTDILIQ